MWRESMVPRILYLIWRRRSDHCAASV